MPALALTADLVLVSQLSGAAARSGTSVETVMSGAQLLARAACMQPALVLLDLAHEDVDPAALVPQLKAIAPAARIVAFGPHVHRQRLAAAATAGCDAVLSRGGLHAEMDAILQRSAP
jgi:DNA-binding NarL/FixJ family response regulator